MEAFDSEMQRQVHRSLEDWANQVKATAMQNILVKTGYLRSTLYAVVNDWVAEIGAEASYALFVELGTRNMNARPYLYPAVQQNLPQLENLVLEAIDSAKIGAGLG
jgi:HK97 gp10 family phage protein